MGTCNEFQTVWLSLNISVVVCYNRFFFNIFSYLGVFKDSILESESISVIRFEDKEVAFTFGLLERSSLSLISVEPN
jgi:hypothetical protein